MTDIPSPVPVAAFRGAVTCHHTSSMLTLTGAAADVADERLILTFITPTSPGLPGSLAGPAVVVPDGRRYRITSGSRAWTVEATSVHLHRDIGNAFYRAVPSRPAPLRKRLFWRVVLALAHTAIGKRALLAVRRK